MTLCRSRKDIPLPTKRGHSSVLRPCKAVPKIDDDNKTAGSPSYLLQYSTLRFTRRLAFSKFITSLTVNICEMRMAGDLEGNIGKCAGGEASHFVGDGCNMTP